MEAQKYSNRKTSLRCCVERAGNRVLEVTLQCQTTMCKAGEARCACVPPAEFINVGLFPTRYTIALPQYLSQRQAKNECNSYMYFPALQHRFKKSRQP